MKEKTEPTQNQHPIYDYYDKVLTKVLVPIGIDRKRKIIWAWKDKQELHREK